MTTIIRSRTIRPSTRLEQSKSYKINTKVVSSGDILIVNIDHESKTFKQSYTFDGKDVKDKNSISFRVNDYGNRIDISWSGATPKGFLKPENKVIPPKIPTQKKVEKTVLPDKQRASAIKGLLPVVNEKSKVLILGTMPGKDSLSKQAYYGNDRNLFWKLMAEVTGKKVPSEYESRKIFLLENKIALWDVCQTCFREGSLDSAISGETPNKLIPFLQKYPKIKAIALNGQTAEKLFAKYFGQIPGIEVFSMPSTSAANAGVKWETKVGEWGKIRKYLNKS